MPESATGLTLEVKRTGSTVVMRCQGKLVAGVQEVLYSRVREVLPDTKRLVLDLSDLMRIDSMGLGALVRAYVSARSGGCTLELINLHKPVWMVLKTANLLSAFSVVGEHYIKMG